ncbi:MAG: DEAD/DEAH box helicase [Planctomycetota bacterium]
MTERDDQRDEERDGRPSFSDLGLHPDVLSAVLELGYETPTPIQERAIPPLCAGLDLVGQAQTGTGKTAAFGLPLLSALRPGEGEVQALVLAPTRELALQVAQALEAYGANLRLQDERAAAAGPGAGRRVRVLAVYGGAAFGPQLKALKRGVDVVVGTPGRVKDHLERGTLSLAGARFLVLDEADEMLTMGFIEDVEWILGQAHAERQVALFSATFPPPIREVADRHLRQDALADVRTAARTRVAEGIEQLGLRVRDVEDKDRAVDRILAARREREEQDAVLVFVATRQATEELTDRLQAQGHEAEAVHGGIAQEQREAVVRRLREGRTRVVVATDVAARGLDIDGVGLVINYDLPRAADAYVHRIGRTGRAGREGQAITLWRPRERGGLSRIERVAGRLGPLELPSEADLLDLRRERMLRRLREHAGEGAKELEGAGFRDLLTELTGGEEPLDHERIAAAALRLAWGPGPLHLDQPEWPEWGGRPARAERRERDEERPARPQRDRGPRERTPRDGAGAGEVDLVLPLGRRDRLRPKDVVGAIAGETGLPGSVVGAIRIMERVTFVSIPGPHVDDVLEALQGARMVGRVIHARRADAPRDQGGEDERPRGRKRRDQDGGEDERPRGRKRRDQDGGEDERPRGRKRRDQDGGEDERPQGRKRRDQDGGDDERPRGRKRRDEPQVEAEPPRSRSRRAKQVEGEDEAPASRSRRAKQVEGEDEAPASRSRRAKKVEGEDEAPRSRSRRAKRVESEDEAPRSRSRRVKPPASEAAAAD